VADSNVNLLSFIPIDRRLALARGESLPDRATGAALIADVSGFTPLTERLAAALGPQRGAEVLTRHLDTIYGTLIEPIERYGGSVVSFSGDAITCWFDQDTGRRAIAAALTMRADMQALPPIALPDGPPVHLATKIAVAHGAVRRLAVGDPQAYRLEVLAGRLLDTLSALQAGAEKGEIVVDEPTAKRLAPMLSLAARREVIAGLPAYVVTSLGESVAPSPWLGEALPPLSEAIIRPWIAPAVYERQRFGGGEFLADLRPAVALFVSFAGINYDDDDDAGLLLDAYIRKVQAILARYEGALVNLTMGDKGGYLLAVFGAPVAHDDDAARGIAAALELLTPPPQLGFIRQVRIGLAQGPMYSGAYGCNSRRTYGVQADKTNLAARLMEQAKPGEILCDDEVYRQARRRWAFEMLPALRVKGKAGLIRAYRATGRPAPPAGRGDLPAEVPPLVGRAGELAQLEKLMEALQAGEGGVLAITGEAGIGKSRLVAALVQLARERGLTGLIGAGQSVEQSTAYRAWRDLLTSFFDLDEVADQGERRARIQRASQDLVPRMGARLPLLNDILAVGLPNTPLIEALDPALRHESLAGLVVALFRAWVRERPLIIVLEDAHWLDQLSWQLTLQVARALFMERSPLLLVLVSRGLDEAAAGAEVMAALAPLAAATTIALSSLNPEQTTAVAAQRLGLAADALPEPAAVLIRERAGGNPFFAEELAHALRDRGLIRIEPGDAGMPSRCTVSAELAAVHALLPDTLQGLILSRIDRLPAEQQFTLKIAAVIGRRFAYPPLYDALQHFAAAPQAALTAQLEALAQQELTALEAAEPELTYLFKHIVIHEVAYETLLFAQRRQIHQVVAEWYRARWESELGFTAEESERQAGRAATLLPLLVRHYREAEDPGQERYFARLAGQQSARQYANAEAVQFFSRALTLTPAVDSTGRFELGLARATVYALMGEREGQAQDLKALEALAQGLGAARQAEVRLRQADYHYQTGDYPAACLAAEQAVTLAATAGGAETEARGFLQWGMALWQQAHYAEAQARNDQALAIARHSGLTSIEADCLRQQGVLFDAQADFGAARSSLEAALQLHQAIHDKRGEAKCLNSLGVVAYNQEDYAAANDYYLHSLEIKQEMGDRYGQGITLQNLGIVAGDRGELEPAQAFFERALAVCREIGDREGEASALDGLGTAALRLGDYDAAETHIIQALDISRRIGDRVNESAGLTNLSTLRHALGEHATAYQHSLDALAIAQAIGARYYEAVAWQHVGQGRRHLGQNRLAVEAFQTALDLFAALEKPRFALGPLTGQAASALALGRLDEAAKYVDQILAITASDPTDAASTPINTYLACYRVLASRRDLRAGPVLRQAHDLLQARAGRIADTRKRQQFLQRIPDHRELLLAWQEGARP
jgi:predicted ATPase/class 3 adenylate cyclase